MSAVGASTSLLSLRVCPAEQEPVRAPSHVSTHTQGALQPQGCWLSLPAQPGRWSQGRHSSACCPERPCPLGNPKGFHRKIAQSGIYSSTPLWASGFLPVSSFPTTRSTYDRNSARLKLESTNSGAVDMGGRHRQTLRSGEGTGMGRSPEGSRRKGRRQAKPASSSPGSEEGRTGQGQERELGFGTEIHHSS